MIVREKINDDAREKLLQDSFGDMFKLVADIERNIVAVGGTLHSDCEEELLEQGSQQNNLWGANCYRDGRIDFVSLINVRPAQNNRSMEIQDPVIRQKVEELIERLL